MMADQAFDRNRVVSLLNQILEIELGGVVRYSHYSLMVFGYNRIPIVSWLRDQATGDILRESMETEQGAKSLYEELLVLVRDKSVFLEEYARAMIAKEEEHLGTVDKMLRKPGDIAAIGRG